MGFRSPSGPLLARCLGADRANRAFFRQAPENPSRSKSPRTLPSGVSQTRNRLASSASRSCLSRSLARWASARSGATTSRIARPRCFRALASWSAASSIRCSSARCFRSGSRSSGRRSTPPMIASACSSLIRASVSAAAVIGCASRPLASRHCRCASGRVSLLAARQPVRCRHRLGGLDRLGLHDQPRPERGTLGLEGRELVQRLGDLPGVHRPHRRVRDLGERRPGSRDRGPHPGHRRRRDL